MDDKKSNPVGLDDMFGWGACFRSGVVDKKLLIDELRGDRPMSEYARNLLADLLEDCRTKSGSKFKLREGQPKNRFKDEIKQSLSFKIDFCHCRLKYKIAFDKLESLSSNNSLKGEYSSKEKSLIKAIEVYKVIFEQNGSIYSDDGEIKEDVKKNARKIKLSIDPITFESIENDYRKEIDNMDESLLREFLGV